MISLLAAAVLVLPKFEDITAASGLSLDTNQACFADFDQDGLTDLCAAGGVWRNNSGADGYGKPMFTKVANVGLGVAADYDNDGYPDIFSWSEQKLYHNDAGKGFTVVPLPDLPPTVSRGACWGDFNGDGFVDLYVGGYEDWDKNITYPSFLLMNRAGKSFEVTWTDATYRTRGVTACDFDRDGDLDVYVSNYRLQPNRLWINDGLGKFADRAGDYNAVATSPGFDGGHSIGAAWGDFDNDGEIDLFAGNFAHVDDRGDQPKSRFLKNLGKAGGYKFQDLGPCGVFYQESYATPAAADFDNDGKLDLYFTTVYGTASFGKKNFPVLYHNDGAFSFSDVTAATGLAEQPPTYQAAWADVDRDGRMDLATGGKLFLNRSAGGSWLEVRLVGDGKAVNRSAVGAQVRIRIGDRIFARQVEAGTGEGNQNDLCLHFGLGSVSNAKQPEVEVTWPNGKKQVVWDVRANSQFTVRYGQKLRASQLNDSFPDVPSNHWAYEGLQNLKASGLLVGYPDRLLRGNVVTYRREFAVYILRSTDRFGGLLRQWEEERGELALNGPKEMSKESTTDARKSLAVGLAVLRGYKNDLRILERLTAEFTAELGDVKVSGNDLIRQLRTWERMIGRLSVPESGDK